MTGITSSIQNLISSIVEIFQGIFNTLFSGIQGVFSVIYSFISSLGSLAMELVQFLLRNIIIIGVIIVGLVGYAAYQQRQGNSLTGGKNKKLA